MSPYEITHPGGSVEHMNEGLEPFGCKGDNTYPATI